MHFQDDDALKNKAWMEALAGGAAGLGLAAVLALAAAFALSGGAFGQALAASPSPALESARFECEAGARQSVLTGRALGACDLLLRDSAVSGGDRARVLTNRAVMLLARGQANDARLDLEQAITLSPDLAEAWLNLSAAQIGAGAARQALETAARAAELGADPALVRFNQAIALETLGRYEDAYAAYSQAAAQAPDNATLAAQPARFVWHQPGA